MVSRYFYLINYAIRSDEKSNIVQKNQLSFEEYLDWLWVYGNDNLLVRMITGKISKDMIIENKHKLKKFKKKIIRINSKDVELAKKILKNFDVVMFENINTFNWTKYFTNLSISFPFFNINNFLYYNKINYKRKYFKYMKYDYELYRYFLNKLRNKFFKFFECMCIFSILIFIFLFIKNGSLNFFSLRNLILKSLRLNGGLIKVDLSTFLKLKVLSNPS